MTKHSSITVMASTIDAAFAQLEAKKAAREAERAKRFPVAAKQEAAEKADKAAGKSATRVATPKVAQVEFVVRTAQPGKPVYAISDLNNARPNAGTRLFAHTHAALSMMGLLVPGCPPATKRAVISILGSTAVAYHISKGNMADAPNACVRLTSEGYEKFVSRRVDNALANDFVDLFLTGKPGRTGVDAAHIFQLA